MAQITEKLHAETKSRRDIYRRKKTASAPLREILSSKIKLSEPAVKFYTSFFAPT